MEIQFKVEQNTWDANPREWENLSKMVCFHGRYNLGDKTIYSQRDVNSWAELEKLICKTEDVLHIEPLYLYDHSGLAISTKPFSCPWDSGQIGVIYEVYNLSYTVDGEEMLEGSTEIYGYENVEKIKEEIIKSLENVQN